jgi:O-antigen/teichoic acid export membrane protein
LILGTSDYFGGEKYLPFLILGALTYGLYSFAGLGIFYSKKMGLNLLALSVGLAAVIATNAILIPFLKEMGAALGYMAGNIIMVTVAYRLSRPYYKIEFSMLKDAITFIVLLALLLSTAFLFHSNLYTDALIKITTIIPMFLLIGLLLLTRKEKDFLFGLLKRKKK